MIHFVGAGSGAVDLITVRGQKLLEEADIVVYAGSLVNAAWLRGISGVPARTGGDGDEPSEFGAADAVYVWPRAAGRNSGDRPAVGH